jgi:hypothetical protein
MLTHLDAAQERLPNLVVVSLVLTAKDPRHLVSDQDWSQAKY